jgi:hypothetical protein
MKKLHLFGITIISLVVAALINTPSFYIGLSKDTRIQMIILITFLILIALTAILRIFMNWGIIPAWVSVFFGVALFITSGYMFFYNTDYFLHAINMPMPYWHRVSFYTLPAIALESAIVTGFEYIMNTANKLTGAEKKKITLLFIFYTITTMAINFLAIGTVIDVALHITIARLILIFSAAIIIAVAWKQVIKNIN